MAIQFKIKDEHRFPLIDRLVTRRLYKGLIKRLDREGKMFRVETQYEDAGATPTKTLTILKRAGDLS